MLSFKTSAMVEVIGSFTLSFTWEEYAICMDTFQMESCDRDYFNTLSYALVRTVIVHRWNIPTHLIFAT